jgi:outer membrane protein OmpA-like peptidoglycan-associated protein
MEGSLRTVLVVVALAASSKAEAGEFDLGLYGGRWFAGPEQQIGSSWLVMPRIGYHVVPRLAIEGEFGFFQGETRVDGVAPRVYDGLSPRLGVQYSLVPEDRVVRPFIEGGPGLFRQFVHRDGIGRAAEDDGRGNYKNPDTDLMINAGPGLWVQLVPALALRTDLRYMMLLGGEETSEGGDLRGDVYSSFEWTVGLSLTLGREKVIEDSDGDGLLDPNDPCPTDPEDVDQFEDTDGCPELDNDKDGLVDALDQCPIEKEDADSFQDGDGCPDPDNDGDGVLDLKDKCPLVEGPADRLGCPPVDTDGDSVLDEVDDCPQQAGDPALKGCPRVVVRADKIDILERVYFDTSKATIKAESFGLLDDVAKVLQDHPELTKIEVAGHTDDQGADASNLALSQGRATAVLEYLVKKGVDRGRLTAKGYGEGKPIVANTDDASRATNRRVEFVILARAEPAE